jgi:hypothetical protein
MTTENTTEKLLDETPSTIFAPAENPAPAPTKAAFSSNRIGAFWKKERNGESFLSGELEMDGKKIYVSLFKNNKKVKPNQPDFNLVLSKNQPTEKEFI